MVKIFDQDEENGPGKAFTITTMMVIYDPIARVIVINREFIETTICVGLISCLASVEDSSRYFVLQNVTYNNEAGTFKTTTHNSFTNRFNSRTTP